jgi:TetR/AcrR family transcriptional regulator, cholesterol catabolism regulator
MFRNKSKITDAAKNRKNEIIEGSLKLFAQYGYHSTSLNDVASKIGVTKATLYYYFRSKDEIMKAILERSMARMDKVLDLDKSDLSSQDKLRQFIQYHIIFGSDGAELAKITFDQLSAFPKRMRTTLKTREKKVDAVLQRIIEQGLEDGSVEVQDVKIASYAILGICNWTYHWYRPGGRLAPEKIAEICIDLIENGYLAKPDQPQKKEGFKAEKLPVNPKPAEKKTSSRKSRKK